MCRSRVEGLLTKLTSTADNWVSLGLLDIAESDVSYELVEWGGRRYAVIDDLPGNIEAQLRFWTALADGGIATPEYRRCPNRKHRLLIEYPEGSVTLARSLRTQRVQRWGSLVAQVHKLRFSRMIEVDLFGRPRPTAWQPFIQAMIERVVSDQRVSQAGLTPALMATASAKLRRLLDYRPNSFVLTHGELHPAAVLEREDNFVLIGKSGAVWAAPAIYDLAVLHAIAFPGVVASDVISGRYQDLPGRYRDPMFARAFFKGYGQIPEAQKEWLKPLVLLQALSRYPNPFAPWRKAMIEATVDSLD